MVDSATLNARLAELDGLVPGTSTHATVTGTDRFASAFHVDEALFSASAAAAGAFGTTEVESSRITTMCAGQASIDGEPVPVWASLSGYYDTADGGTIQLHCNFPHHAEGVVVELGCDATKESVQAAILDRDPLELEGTLIEQGLIAARLRTLGEWDQHPHAIANATLPLLTVERIGDAAPSEPGRRLRVLDCSRVLAGPIAGLLFAGHGADVIRVGAPSLPSVQIGVLTTGSGKRNAYADLDTDSGRTAMTGLLDGADVWIDAFRPGALAAKGLDLDSVRPGSIVVQLCAFGWEGPWAGRRGYDSIVQSTTGIVRAGTEAAGAEALTPLPVQALDYTTGLLAAFAARRLIDHQQNVGGTWLVRLSLLSCRNWLVGMGAPSPFEPSKPQPEPSAMYTSDTPFGAVTTAKPISGSWPFGPQPLGSSAPVWE